MVAACNDVRTVGFEDANQSDSSALSDVSDGSPQSDAGLPDASIDAGLDAGALPDHPVYKDELEMTGQVHALNYLKQCRGGEYIPNPK